MKSVPIKASATNELKDLTAERLRELLRYDEKTGLFYWRKHRFRGYAGKEAGTLLSTARSENSRYIGIVVDGKRYQAHRLAWLYMSGSWPVEQIDHLNMNGRDNRWCNLRAATHAQNKQNTKIQPNNTSGHKGVNWNRGKWRAYISANGRWVHLGRFQTLEEAIAVRNAAAKQYHGEFARHI